MAATTSNVPSKRENKKTPPEMKEVPVHACREAAREPLDPPPRNRVVARAEVVSWLRASFARLPGHVRDQWLSERDRYDQCPLQWRGRTGITPVSVSPTRVEL